MCVHESQNYFCFFEAFVVGISGVEGQGERSVGSEVAGAEEVVGEIASSEVDGSEDKKVDWSEDKNVGSEANNRGGNEGSFKTKNDGKGVEF